MQRFHPCRALCAIAFLALAYAASAQTTLQVTSDADAGLGTLRQAINEANNSAEPVLIECASSITIILQSPLPPVTTAIGVTFADTNAITLNCAAISSSSYALDVQGSQVEVAGLKFQFAAGTALALTGTTNTVRRCIFELYAVGVEVAAASNTIGGSLLDNANGFYGNTDAGVIFNGIGSQNSTVSGCLFGIHPVDSNAAGNGTGVRTVGAVQVTIGGSSVNAKNYICRSTGHGIDITANSNSIDIKANVIGLGLSGEALGNSLSGIHVTGSSSVNIGGTGLNEGNYICASGEHGIQVEGSSLGVTVLNNSIGVGVANAIRGNTGNGVSVGATGSPASNVTIGSTALRGRNIIGFNEGNGVGSFTGSSATFVVNNLIGVLADGAPAANARFGVLFSSNNSGGIGGSEAGSGNVISGNTLGGIRLSNCANVTVYRNIIGLSPDESEAVANDGPGIILTQGHTNVIGAAGMGNIIAGNSGDGIEVGTECDDMFIQSNRIGLNSLDADFGNDNGIYIDGATASFLGNTNNPGEGNIIAGNTSHGILATGGSGNSISANSIGLDGAGVAKPNGMDGIHAQNTQQLAIGGGQAAARNYIGGNTGNGILLDGAAGTAIRNNFIGRNEALEDRPNGLDGIAITGGSTDTVIGNLANFGNVIEANNGNGIRINASQSNTVRDNRITRNAGKGIALESGANGGISAPVITSFNPIHGTGPANAVIEFFTDEGDQGAIQRTVAVSDSLGDFFSPVDVTVFTGLNLTATATLDSNTSEFSAPLAIAIPGEGEATIEGEGAADGEGTVDGEGTTEGEGEGEGNPGNPLYLQCTDDSIASQAPGAQPAQGADSTNFDGSRSFDSFSNVFLAIVSVRWWGRSLGIFGGDCDGSLYIHHIAFYTNNAGSPGTLVHEEDVTVRMYTPTGRNDNNQVPEYVFQADLSEPVFLSNGWISITRNTNPSCFFNWTAAASGNGTSITQAGLNNTNNSFDLAYCLIGHVFNSGDYNHDGALALNELLRIIQLYNANGYSCAIFGSEDNYDPGGADCTGCGRHDVDFQGEACHVELSEVLRAVQLFSFEGYIPCTSNQEDGFCPAP